MGADMSVWNIWLTDAQRSKWYKNESPFDTEAIIQELDTMLRNEKDKEVFTKLYEMSSALADEALVFETLWSLHNSENQEDKILLEPFYESIKDAHRQMIKDITDSLNSNDVTMLHIPGYVEFITGGLSWGDSPTETHELWYSLLGDNEEGPNPYAAWLESKISVVPFANTAETKGE